SVEIAGMNTGLVERLLVVRDIVVSTAERPFQALQLESRDLVTRSCFDRIKAFARRHQVDAFELQTRHSNSYITACDQIFRFAAFQCFSKLAIRAGLKWQ